MAAADDETYSADMSTKRQHRVGRGQRVGLTRDGIVAAAIDLIERDGLEAFSLRRLAGDLGVDPMSLYNHVEHKDDLFDGIVEAVFTDVAEAIGGWSGSWQDQIRRGSGAFREVLLRRPQVSVLVLTRRVLTDVPLSVIRGGMNPGLTAGMTPEESIRILRVVTAFLTGTVLRELGSAMTFAAVDPERADQRLSEVGRSDDPVLAGVADSVVVLDHDAIFEYGVEVLIDGIAAKLDTSAEPN